MINLIIFIIASIIFIVQNCTENPLSISAFDFLLLMIMFMNFFFVLVDGLIARLELLLSKKR